MACDLVEGRVLPATSIDTLSASGLPIEGRYLNRYRNLSNLTRAYRWYLRLATWYTDTLEGLDDRASVRPQHCVLTVKHSAS